MQHAAEHAQQEQQEEQHVIQVPGQQEQHEDSVSESAVLVVSVLLELLVPTLMVFTRPDRGLHTTRAS